MQPQLAPRADSVPYERAPGWFPSLACETRIAVDTACAAHHLNRAQQTLRIWACRENGPIRPIRINGRLAWPVAEIKRLLGVE